jgi:fatty acid desaturase
MDETVYRHARLDRDRLAAFNARGDAPGLIRFAGHLGALLVTGFLLSRSLGTLWVAPATLLYGAVLIFLFAPLHETIHRTAFKTRWLNDTVGWVCGAVLVLPPEYFRAFHFAHHRWTQDPAQDPELAAPKPTSLAMWLLHVSGLRYWRAQLTGLVRRARGRTPEPFLAGRVGLSVVQEAQMVLWTYVAIGGLSVVTGSTLALTYWVIPALVAQPLLRLYLLAEHTGCPFVPDMLANTRTTLTNAIVRFFAWNMPYHTEHHAFPSVPFHRLPALHRELRADLKVVGQGYIAVSREIARAAAAGKQQWQIETGGSS